MSLDYRLDKVPPEVWKPRGGMTDETTSIIFGCIATGIGEITEDNWSEWYARYELWDRMRVHIHDSIKITPALVRAHIGLWTNVFPEQTRAEWYARIVGRELDFIASTARHHWDEVSA